MKAIGAIGTAMALISLSACGGGGAGSTPSPAPIPAPTPTPTQTPTPTPTPTVNYNTIEYRNSNGASFHKAITAYQAGANGAGIVVGVVDSGLSNSTGEFSGRISPFSADFAGNSSYDDVSGHGTAVSAVIAASRNNQNIMGMAWGATIMALRTDDQSDCVEDDGCTHPTTSIAAAIDHARTNGARVINVSLGGGAAPNHLLQAVRRATQAGIIIVISAGNNEDGEAPLVAPDELAQSFANPAYGNGLVIIASSVNDNDTVSSFSAGVAGFENVSMAALGNRVLTFDHTGTDYLYSGTSFSAPQISGAAALLAGAFPNLSSQQIVELLLSKARDVGAPGADARYGVGILDVAAAFAPVGPLALAGSAIPLAATTPSILSAPMGDASPAAISAVALDDYRRAYQLDLTPSFTQAATRHSLVSALDVTQRRINLGSDALGIAFNIRQAGLNVTTRDPLAFTQADEHRAKLISGTFNAKLSSITQMMLGLRTGLTALEQRLSKHPTPSFVMADHGFDSGDGAMRPQSAIAMSQQAMSGLTITGGFEHGEMISASHRQTKINAQGWRGAPYQAASLSLGYDRGGLGLTAGATILDEKASMLGARLSANYGAQSARSLFTRIGARATLPGEVALTANWQRGWTHAASGGALRDGGRLMSQSWSAELARQNILTRGDIIGLRVSQPLRVIASRFNLILPQSWDWEQEIATEASVPLNLVPRGRQRDYELSYGRAIGPSWLGTNIFLREQSGNIAAMPDELGMALRWSVGF